MILVIDDDSSLRRVFVLALQSVGFAVVDVEDGAKALQLLQSVRVDLVITDILMPNVDGIELMQEVRRRDPGMPIIAMSGGGMIKAEDCLGLATKFGANCVLRKPFSLAELVQAVRDVLGQSVDAAETEQLKADLQRG